MSTTDQFDVFLSHNSKDKSSIRELFQILDEQYDRMYRTEMVMGSLTRIFAILAIFIACLGLFGLASFTAQQRTKEIGVRKVMGASVGSVIVLLSKEFSWLVILALFVATPVSWFVMTRSEISRRAPTPTRSTFREPGSQRD